ncbi:MAG: hypothetical protein GX781_06615, partial [Clostridiales bacterium]|nr:hypothetical protein [Clostridiales bacterium]
AQEQNIGFIRGIEISAEGDREVHILGYSINAGNKAFDNLIEALRHDRISRERKYLNTLQDMHIFISSADLRIPSGSLFSRPLLAKAMKDKGYVNSMQEAFDMYLGAGKPAYVPKLSVTADEVIKTLCLAGAVPVIAHPGLLHLSSSDLEKQIIQWKASGLMGIEVYHPSHNQLDCQKFLLLAKKYNLLVTGGSDFHEKADLYHGELGQMLSIWHEASIDTSKLLASIH